VPFHAVIARCVRDAVAEHYRWQERHGVTPMGERELREYAKPAPDPAERDPDPRADQRVLSEALGKLGNPDAQIVWMKSIEDLPTREIAGRLQLSEGNVNTHYSRARTRLAELIHEAVRNQP